MTQQVLQDWYPTAPASRVLNITPARLRQMARKGQIEFVETPLGRLYHRDVVEKLAREREAMARNAQEAA